MPAELRLIVSSTQIIANEKGMDEWGLFPHARQRLFDLIKTSGASGVLLLSGNVHFSEVSKIDAGNIHLYEFTSSGMTHVTPEYANAPNKYRIVGPFIDHNIGLVEIDWDTDPAPVIQLSALGIGNQQGFSYELSLGDLR